VVNPRQRVAADVLRRFAPASVVGIIVCAAGAAPPPDELNAWATQFAQALESRGGSVSDKPVTFSDDAMNEPGVLPIAQRLILYKTVVTGDTTDLSPGSINALRIGIGGGDAEAIAITPICEAPIEIAPGGPDDSVVFYRLITTGQLVTGVKNSAALQRHMLAAFEGGEPGLTFDAQSATAATDQGLASEDLRVTWMEATATPASPVAQVSPEVTSLQAKLTEIAQGIVKFGIDRQPEPLQMVKGQFYVNATREVVREELESTRGVEVSGWAAVYGDRVLLLTLVETQGAAFIVDGQLGQVFGPYEAGTMLLPAVVDALWTGGRIEPGDPLVLFAAN
jgi:hypothetical protein